MLPSTGVHMLLPLDGKGWRFCLCPVQEQGIETNDGIKKKCDNMSSSPGRKKEIMLAFLPQKENIVAMTSLTPVHGFPRLELLLPGPV